MTHNPDSSRDHDRSRDNNASASAEPPAGNYPVRTISHNYGKAGTGTHQIGCMLTIVEGPFAGRAYPWYGSFTADATPITMRGMRALGFEGDDLVDCSGMYKPDVKAIGVLEVDQDRDGNPRRRFSFVNGFGVAMKETLQGGDLAAFAKQMRGTIARLGGAGGNDRPAAPSSGGSGYYEGGGGRQPPPAGATPPPREDERQRSFNGGGDPTRSPDRREVPPPSDGDAPPWGGSRGGGGNTGSGGRGGNGRW